MSIAEKLSLIAENEQKVYNAGYQKGKSEGGDTETAYNDGFEAGKKSEYDLFWDAYQEKGIRTYYLCAFAGTGWNADNFLPKYPLTVTNATEMFFHAFGNVAIDLVSHCNNNNIILDFSNNTMYNNTFSYSGITRLGTLDMSKVPSNSSYHTSNMLLGSVELHTIEKIISHSGIQWSAQAFGNTSKLANITFEGEIGRSIYLQYSPLTVDSMKSVINHLVNYSGTDEELVYTVSFSSACWEALEASGTAPNGDTWHNYVALNLGWNV